MNNRLAKLELHKVEREIKVHGREYVVYRDSVDKYGETTGENEEVMHIKALFHTSKGYVTKNVSDGSTTHSKGQPKLLLAYDASIDIKNDDFVLINDKRYNVVEKNNIQEYNIICDISLELVLDGKN